MVAPVIANSDRIVSYSPNASAGPFPVPFPLFDNTGADLRVTLDGEVVAGWTLAAAAEPGFYGSPNTYTNCSITFSAPISGALVIKGRRAPRRTSNYEEGRGIPAKDLNVELNTLTAIAREVRADVTANETLNLAQQIALVQLVERADDAETRLDGHDTRIGEIENNLVGAPDNILAVLAQVLAAAASVQNPDRKFVVTSPPFNYIPYSSEAAAEHPSSLTCDTAVRQAAEAANLLGGIVYFPPGYYAIQDGLDGRGLSNVHFISDNAHLIPKPGRLNGSDNITRNNVFQFLNFDKYGPDLDKDYDPVNGGYKNKNVSVQRFHIHCKNQNGSGIVVDGHFGRSLSAIETLGIDNFAAIGNKIYDAYGNGIVAGTVDPRAYDENGVRVGAQNPIIEGNEFYGCLRGVLPQYATALAPAGITGSVIQVGSCIDGRVSNNYCKNASGPFLDRFNDPGLKVFGNRVEGFGLYPVGAHPDSRVGFHQHVGMVRSDFGMSDHDVVNNTFIGTGGVFDSGAMTEFFQTGQVRTPGPRRGRYIGNRFIRPSAGVQITAPAIGASGEHYAHRQPSDIYTYPVLIQWVGGTNVTFLRKRGVGTVPTIELPEDSFAAYPAGPNKSLVIYRGDEIVMNYSVAPSSWSWFVVPNIDAAAMYFHGGSVTDHPAQCLDLLVRGNYIEAPGTMGIAGVDVSRSRFEANTILDPGAVYGARAIQFGAAIDQAGGGSSDNVFSGNHALDRRDTSALMQGIYSDAGPRNLRNRIVDNHIGAGIAASPTIPATTVEFANPFGCSCIVTVSGGTVSAIAVGPAGSTVVTGVTSGPVVVPNGQVIKLTYTVAPTWVWTASAVVETSTATTYISRNFGSRAPTSDLGAAPSVPATTVEFANPYNFDCNVSISGGTVTQIAVGAAGATRALGLTSGQVLVRHGEVIKITHSSAPTWVWTIAT
ncbi:right-handed parallel beta-helix repeat-containing protein [Bosea sp. BK604]|uniref:right-handed parallel beta-helix repeat-containing protein n=1 Tax=Bosea sp. BK604 TaxID=2512180 RepID=UPI0010533278|nr:right-handed parallel beta-helix repeat-containing protein [Bosea sp. BK604]TCR64699.1 hypothetical protein EV560_106165 [Bosea sp. BK604]